MKLILLQALLTGALVQATVGGGSLRESKRSPSFKWLGVDESVAEFGSGKYPGTYGIDYRFPDENTIGVSTVSLPQKIEN